MVASTQATLAEIAETWELSDPPDVTVIRTVSPEEFDDLLQSCMASAGFPRRPDYSYSSDGQDEAFAIAWYTCHAQYPIDDLYTQPLTDAQMRFWYAYLIEDVVPCYRENGWQVDDASIPSEGLFIATFGTMDTWAPYLSDPTGLAPDEIERIQTDACPLWPPSEELYAPELLAED